MQKSASFVPTKFEHIQTIMTQFATTAVKKNARNLLKQQSRITLTTRDFQDFTAALNAPFNPNPALQNALSLARKVKRS